MKYAPLTYVSDLGLWTFNRGKESCKWKTTFCAENCYNNKLYRIYKDMVGRDKKNEEYWANCTVDEFSKELQKKKLTKFRFCSRGEIFDTPGSLRKVKEIIIANPKIDFKIPTRAWRNPRMKKLIEDELFDKSNAYVLASLDPSNNWDVLEFKGWRSIFYGNNYQPIIMGSYKCPKTWKHEKGVCGICKGCFTRATRHIWLKKH